MAVKTLKGKSCQIRINAAVMRNIQKLLEPGSNVQKFFDSEVARLSDNYAPSDTTNLRKSVWVRSTFGSGQIIYEIYGSPTGWNTWNGNNGTATFQGAPRRGAEWTVRMLHNGGKEKLDLALRRFIQRIGL